MNLIRYSNNLSLPQPKKPNTMLKSNTIRMGILIGLLGIIINVLIYVINPAFFANISFALILFVVYITAYFFAMYSIRKTNDGYLSFKEAYFVALGVMMISTFVELSFKLVLYNVIDTELAGFIQNKTVENTTALMERFNVPEEEIEKAVEKIDVEGQYSAISMLKGYGWGILISAVVALIIAAIVKKDKQTFESIVDNT